MLKEFTLPTPSPIPARSPFLSRSNYTTPPQRREPKIERPTTAQAQGFYGFQGQSQGQNTRQAQNVPPQPQGQ